MNGKRPKLSLQMTPIDIVIEAISALAIIFIVLLLSFAWNKLPGTIPIHYDALGNVNGYGGKENLLFLLPLILVLYAGLTVLAKFPHIYNYAVEITEENAEFQYRIAARLMRLLKLELVLLFGYIETIMIMSAMKKGLSLGIWFLPATLLIMFGTIGFYIYKSVKNK